MVGPISETVGFGPTNDPGGPKATAGAATRAIAAEATTATRAPPRGQRRRASWDTEDLDLISGSCPCDGHGIAVRGEADHQGLRTTRSIGLPGFDPRKNVMSPLLGGHTRCDSSPATEP